MTVRLIEWIVAGERSPQQLADGAGMSLDELADWFGSPVNADRLRRLAMLADLRTQMLVSQYRAAAAVRLLEIASNGKDVEPARKACVDLLRTSFASMETADRGAELTQPPVSEAAILEALSAMGHRDTEPEDGPPTVLQIARDETDGVPGQ